MKIRLKKLHENAIIPQYAHATDAGMDLKATSKWYDKWGNICYGTGIAVEIPEGYVGLLFPRSSNSKKLLLQSNSVGIIDSGYRGEIMVKFKRTESYYKFSDDPEYLVGERIGQLIIMPYPKVEFEEVEELSDTDRGTGGYGSSGK